MSAIVFSIDGAVEADLEDLAAIEAASFGPGENGSRGIAKLHEELARAWSRITVARGSDGRALGFVLAWHVVDELHVLDVAVDPSARRRGIGRALVDDVIAYAKSHAVARVLLEVRAANEAAIALYRGVGFDEHGRRKRYYPDGEDAVEMMLSLPIS